MEKILKQPEIDDLIVAYDHGELQEWITLHEKPEDDQLFIQNYSIYEAEDYDLFYTAYELEKLTDNGSILRRYAYKDSESFKKYEFFMVLDEYIVKGVNMASVVGIPVHALNQSDFDYRCVKDQELVYITDISSLFYICTVSIEEPTN